MKLTLYFSLLCFIISCQPKSYEFEEIYFQQQGYDWDPITYKFPSMIEDSTMMAKGHFFQAWEYSYIGNIKKMHERWDHKKQANPRKDSITGSFQTYKKTNAIEYILGKAADKQVVIINEAHHMPQHRVFTTRLLKGLKEKGFTHLGLETIAPFGPHLEFIKNNGYPSVFSGFYSKEPQFGNMLREANKLGYSIFPYESEHHNNGKQREINQAQNIKEYLESHPKEKMVIHCGFDHGYEGDMSNKWEKAMAGRLKEFTGIDPLTINQTVFSERSKRTLENGIYQEFDLEKPSVFIDNFNKSFKKLKRTASFDIYVFHPRTKHYNRPEWLLYNQRKIVDFDFNNAEIECPCLVFAYVEGEELGLAVPYDIQESIGKKVKLVLEPNNYKIVILNEADKAMKTTLKI